MEHASNEEPFGSELKIVDDVRPFLISSDPVNRYSTRIAASERSAAGYAILAFG